LINKSKNKEIVNAKMDDDVDSDEKLIDKEEDTCVIC
jgi:hypothetical protein